MPSPTERTEFAGCKPVLFRHGDAQTEHASTRQKILAGKEPSSYNSLLTGNAELFHAAKAACAPSKAFKTNKLSCGPTASKRGLGRLQNAIV